MSFWDPSSKIRFVVWGVAPVPAALLQGLAAAASAAEQDTGARTHRARGSAAPPPPPPATCEQHMVPRSVENKVSALGACAQAEAELTGARLSGRSERCGPQRSSIVSAPPERPPVHSVANPWGSAAAADYSSYVATNRVLLRENYLRRRQLVHTGAQSRQTPHYYLRFDRVCRQNAFRTTHMLEPRVQHRAGHSCYSSSSIRQVSHHAGLLEVDRAG